MQSNRNRALVALAAAVVVVVGFVVLEGDDDVEDGSGSTTTTEQSGAKPSAGGASGSREPPASEAPPTILIEDGQPVGGVADLEFSKGEDVRFIVDSDTADEVHVHGYDLMEDVEPGGSVMFDFPADIDGIFEVELEGAATPIAELTVTP